ncbi:unnamed protein product [Lasius platythorax]|uniref:Integrase catalytic domain-containing protein n=1 Tax=Lasius platythorax TaxID=488582 RepID=A0AAV2N5G0_9HYME
MPDKRLKTLTETLADKHFRAEGKPDVIMTDKQEQFVNDKWRLCAKLGIRARTTNPTANSMEKKKFTSNRSF